MEEHFDEWCFLELMGHRKLAGKVSEATVFGGALIRIDIPGKDGAVATQFYSPAAVYCITPTTEAMARAFATNNQPQPVTRWELPEMTPVTASRWKDCPFILGCQKGIMCHDCETYADYAANREGDQDESP